MSKQLLYRWIVAIAALVLLPSPGLAWAGSDAVAESQSSKPKAPTNMTAAVVSATSAYLTWTDNANNENCYEVQKKPSGGDWRVIASCLPANTTKYTATDLITGKGYTFKVKAKNNAGSSDWSNHAGATPCKLAPPTNVLTKISGKTVFVTFNDTNTCEGGYYIGVGWPDKSIRYVFVSPGKSAIPANALPASALPASALPANALPASALPASIAVFSAYAIPANSTYKYQTNGVAASLPPGVSSPSPTVTVKVP